MQIGQQVRCVNDRNWTASAKRITCPVIGVIYTLRGFCGRGGVYLEEIINPVTTRDDGKEESFWAWRFRPVKKTDISVFTAMLNPTPQQVKELEHVDGNTANCLPEG